MCWWTEERIRLVFLLNFAQAGRGLAGLIDDETSALMSLHLCLFIFGRKCCNRLSYIAHSYLACAYLTVHYLAARIMKKISLFASLSVRSFSILYYLACDLSILSSQSPFQSLSKTVLFPSLSLSLFPPPYQPIDYLLSDPIRFPLRLIRTVEVRSLAL